jgi:hypothetical protein
MGLIRKIVIAMVGVLALHASAVVDCAQMHTPASSPVSSPLPKPEPSPTPEEMAQAPTDQEPYYLRDRGTGVATSLFGTYVKRGELIVYPFFEYYRHNGFEYTPSELGSVGEQEFRGRYRAKESLLFFAYGLTENLAVEFEMAPWIEASFEKSPSDQSSLAARIEESGIGDIEAQLRWRWKKETDTRPEFFSYASVVFPHNREKVLIGTPGWEMSVGTGVTRGFSWGTLTGRASLEYSGASDSHFDLGEFAVEYLKRVSTKWRLYAAVEGVPDELSLITEAQWHISKNVLSQVQQWRGFDLEGTRLGAGIRRRLYVAVVALTGVTFTPFDDTLIANYYLPRGSL